MDSGRMILRLKITLIDWKRCRGNQRVSQYTLRHNRWRRWLFPHFRFTFQHPSEPLITQTSHGREWSQGERWRSGANSRWEATAPPPTGARLLAEKCSASPAAEPGDRLGYRSLCGRHVYPSPCFGVTNRTHLRNITSLCSLKIHRKTFLFFCFFFFFFKRVKQMYLNVNPEYQGVFFCLFTRSFIKNATSHLQLFV